MRKIGFNYVSIAPFNVPSLSVSVSLIGGRGIFLLYRLGAWGLGLGARG